MFAVTQALRAEVCRVLSGIPALPREMRRLAKLDPEPDQVQLVPHDALGMGTFGAALVAQKSAVVRFGRVVLLLCRHH